MGQDRSDFVIAFSELEDAAPDDHEAGRRYAHVRQAYLSVRVLSRHCGLENREEGRNYQDHSTALVPKKDDPSR